MQVGLVTDSLADLPLDRVLAIAEESGIQRIEIPVGGWSRSPHVEIGRLLESTAARDELLGSLHDHGLELSALNCSGNPLHPGEDAKDAVLAHDAIALAGLLGVDRVVMMSGLPAAPGDRYPNWITVCTPAEVRGVLDYQWEEVALPFWRSLVQHVKAAGVSRICVEMHAHQLVYNVPTLLRLRESVGPTIGANFDPSHLMWMGADPLAAVEALGDAIYHVHAKDTRIEPSVVLTSRLETLPSAEATQRSWNYVTLGQGHDGGWWRTFCDALRAVGYDDVLSIEHEDVSMDPERAVRETVAVLREAIA